MRTFILNTSPDLPIISFLTNGINELGREGAFFIMQEIWKSVDGFKGIYEVSNLGRIKSLSRLVRSKGGVRATPTKICTGRACAPYFAFDLSVNGLRVRKTIHRLVAQAFIPNPENKPYINHKDGNKINNHVDNLEWVTAKENLQHARDNGLMTITQPVYQLDKTGKILTRFDSIKQASEKSGIHSNSITHCLMGRRRLGGGFGWARAEININNGLN